MERVPPPSLEEKIENFLILESDFQTPYEEQGYAYDVEKPEGYTGINDAEQIYAVSGDEKIVHFKMTIVNPYYVALRIPELVQQAEQNLLSKFANNALVKPMLHKNAVDGLSFRTGQRRPAFTIDVQIDTETGRWDNPQIYLSNGTMLGQKTFTDTESSFRDLMTGESEDPTSRLFWNAAYTTSIRRIGEENTRKKLQKLEQTQQQSPLSSFVFANLSNIIGEVMAEQSMKHTVLVPYWNKTSTVNPQTSWPSRPLKLEILDEYDEIEDDSFIFNGDTISTIAAIPAIEKNAGWINREQPFPDIVPYGHEALRVDSYVKATATLRDICSFMTVVNWTSRLKQQEYLFDRKRIQANCERFVVRTQEKDEDRIQRGLITQQQNREMQMQRRKEEKISRITDWMIDDPKNPSLWKEAMPYFQDLDQAQQTVLIEVITEEKTQLEQQYIYDKERFNNYTMLLSIIVRENNLHYISQNIYKNRKNEMHILYLNPDEEVVCTITAEAKNQKNARRKALEIAALTLLLKIFHQGE